MADGKVFAGLGNGTVADLTDKGSTYVHPATKQCNYTYTHPSAKQCSWVPNGLTGRLITTNPDTSVNISSYSIITFMFEGRGGHNSDGYTSLTISLTGSCAKYNISGNSTSDETSIYYSGGWADFIIYGIILQSNSGIYARVQGHESSNSVTEFDDVYLGANVHATTYKGSIGNRANGNTVVIGYK